MGGGTETGSEWAGVGKSLGAGIGTLFSGGGNYGEGYDKAVSMYQGYMDQATQNIQNHETQGRGDLSSYLAQAQQYGDPYRQAGNSALQTHMGSMGLGGQAGRQSALQAFQTSPSYQFALKQGLGAVQRNNTAAGGRGSGAEQKALTQYATGLANQEYGSWQKGLAGLVGMGQDANEAAAGRTYGTGNQLAQLGSGYSQQQTDVTSQIAQAIAEAQMAKTKAEAQQKSSNAGGWGDVVGGLGGLVDAGSGLAKLFL